MMNRLKGLWKDEQGQSMVEYALIIAGVAVALVAGIVLLKNGINGTFTNIISKL